MTTVSFYRKDNIYKTQNMPTKDDRKAWFLRELLKRHQLKQELKKKLIN